MDQFDKRKKDVLSKADKSNKTNWDAKISELCNKINSLNNYYTTSSCSGRVILMKDQDKKGENLFVSVYHDKISFKKLKEDLVSAARKKEKIKFKLEPCILHVSCRTFKDAEGLYNKTKTAGWKKSGIIGTKNAFTVEMNGTERLEFPIIQGGKILVDDEFLKIIVKESDKKLEKSWLKIKKLEKLMQ
jgi:tRNA wybutosine-synthesizing protein 3